MMVSACSSSPSLWINSAAGACKFQHQQRHGHREDAIAQRRQTLYAPSCNAVVESSHGREEYQKSRQSPAASNYATGTGCLRLLNHSHPPKAISTSAPAQAANSRCIPSLCASDPLSSSPSTMNVLLTRPTMFGGVSCCDIVCAGISTRAIEKPRRNV